MIAASHQNKGFEYAKVLYDNQGTEDTGWLTGREMAGIAASVDGLNLAQWRRRRQQLVHEGDREQRRRARQAQKKVTGTPTIFVGRTGGKLPGRVGSRQRPNARSRRRQAIDAAVASS